MNVVSNEQVSNVVVSNERGLKWSGLKWMASNELVSIVCTPYNLKPVSLLHHARLPFADVNGGNGRSVIRRFSNLMQVHAIWP